MSAKELVMKGVDLTPEHSCRVQEETLHKDVISAYAYVDSVQDTCDSPQAQMWYGWALREAFLAGITHATKNCKDII